LKDTAKRTLLVPRRIPSKTAPSVALYGRRRQDIFARVRTPRDTQDAEEHEYAISLGAEYTTVILLRVEYAKDTPSVQRMILL